MTSDFTGKTALITGAGRGIGRAVALGLADAGTGLILLARSADQLAETQAMVLGRGAAAERIQIIPADLGDEDRRDRAAATALETARVDILVDDAATVEPLGATAAIPAKEFAGHSSSTWSPAALTAAVLPGMLDPGSGRVVNVSSAIVARPAAMVSFNAYAATRPRLRRMPSTWPPSCSAPACRRSTP